MDDLQVRAATPADLPGAERVRLACFPRVFTAAMGPGADERKLATLLGLRACRPDPELGSLVASTSAGEIVGYTAYAVAGQSPGPARARMDALLRGLGLARTARFLVVRALAFLREAPEAGEVYISDIAVLEAWRGRGLAARLVSAAEAETAALGYRRWKTLVGEGNHASRALMRSLGYAETGVRTRRWRGRLMGEGVLVSYEKRA